MQFIWPSTHVHLYITLLTWFNYSRRRTHERFVGGDDDDDEMIRRGNNNDIILCYDHQY